MKKILLTAFQFLTVVSVLETGWPASELAVAADIQLEASFEETEPALSPETAPPVRPYPYRHVWLDVDGKPLPIQQDDEILDFLETAEITSRKRISEGINGIEKVVLEKDDLRVHAAFRNVRIQKTRFQTSRGRVYFNFRDDCIFEIAAYKLSRLLGLNNIPPTVKRDSGRNEGTLQIWVEDAMMEKDRRDKKVEPPQPIFWMYQYQIMYLFDNLIYNDDRNIGNILIDRNWKLWMIDHTRAFRRFKKPKNLGAVRLCDRYIFEKLRALDEEQIRSELKDVLRGAELKALIQRKETIVDHIQQLIDERGERVVLF